MEQTKIYVGNLSFDKNIPLLLLILFFGLAVYGFDQIDLFIIPLATVFGVGIFLIKTVVNFLMYIHVVFLVLVFFLLPSKTKNNLKQAALKCKQDLLLYTKYIFIVLSIFLAYHYGYLKYVLGYIDMHEPLGDYIPLDFSFSFMLLAGLIIFSGLLFKIDN